MDDVKLAADERYKFNDEGWVAGEAFEAGVVRGLEIARQQLLPLLAMWRTAELTASQCAAELTEQLSEGSACSYPNCGHEYVEHDGDFCLGCGDENYHDIEEHAWRS